MGFTSDNKENPDSTSTWDYVVEYSPPVLLGVMFLIVATLLVRWIYRYCSRRRAAEAEREANIQAQLHAELQVQVLPSISSQPALAPLRLDAL